MTESIKVTISNEEYRNLISIALTAKTLVNYYKETDTFKFMVKHAVKDIEKKLQHKSITNIIGNTFRDSLDIIEQDLKDRRNGG